MYLIFSDIKNKGKRKSEKKNTRMKVNYLFYNNIQLIRCYFFQQQLLPNINIIYGQLKKNYKVTTKYFKIKENPNNLTNL